MASNYIIDFSDPLKASFTISPGGFNGPGGTQSASSLRLYGRGALEWGEAVDEDLLRLAETSSSATPPLEPINGQMWIETKYYYLQSGTTWWVYNPDTPGWSTITVTVAGSLPLTGTIGSYYYVGGVLNRWDSAYKQAAAAWLTRSFSTGVAAPINPPEQHLKFWDAFTGGGTWVLTISGSDIVTSLGYTPLNVAGDTMSGNLNMSGFKVTNLGTPTLSGDAANKAYVDTRVSKSGDTMTGDLNMSGFKVTNLGTPTSPGDAANKAYVDAAISGGSASSVVAWTNLNPPGAYKPGDIFVNVFIPIIYIAVNTGSFSYPPADTVNWKQVWPATYS